MITRRDILIASLLIGGTARAAHGAAPLLAADAQPAEELLALSGKRPLIKRTYRPPNFETSLRDLREAFTPNDAFFVRYHSANVPDIAAGAWRLQIGGGSARQTLRLSLDELQRQFERVEIPAINQCSGNRRGLFTPRVAGVQWGYGAMGNAVWSGVRLRDVLRHAGVNADALEVIVSGADTPPLPGTPAFVKSLPIDRALDENTLIAFEMNGAPLPKWNGAPARLVVPGWTATYWIKHLNEIRIEPKAFDGFWMKNGYRLPSDRFKSARFPSQETSETHPITDMVVNSLVTSHANGARIARRSPAQLSGWAWDNGAGIANVEISSNDGRTWRKASLGKDLGRFAWRGFHWPIDTSRSGPVRLSVRASSRNGTTQPRALVVNPSGYHHNAIQVMELEVA